MTAKEITEATLKALKREDNPAGILVEAVIEKQFMVYEELLNDIKTELNNEAWNEEWGEVLIARINKVKQYV